MGKKITKYLLILLFVYLSALILTQSRRSADLALEGLNLWFSRMIPALLPFMILSGILMGLGLSDGFAALFSPFLRPLFSLSDSCLYCIVIGFLCGFPMGAKVCAQSYEEHRISRREATLLLSFCNNIGPVYFVGYVLRLFPVSHPGAALFAMYGIPLLYGICLRRTLFRDVAPALGQKQKTRPLPSLSVSSLLQKMNDSIQTSLDAITVLGGYMIFCNLLNLIPLHLLGETSALLPWCGPLLEITSGISRLDWAHRMTAFLLLPFGGLSCIAQTYSCIRNTDLSLYEYLFHKVVQTMLTAAFYALCRF